MPNLTKMLRDLADAYEREEKGEESAALQKRIDALESKIAGADVTPEERQDAIEEITDEEYELIRQHRAGSATPPVVEEPAPVVDPPAARTRPGRKSGNAYGWTVDDTGKVQKVDIPSIYNGADEPDEVELPAEEPAAA